MKYKQMNSRGEEPSGGDAAKSCGLTSIRTKLIVIVVLVSFVTASLITAMQVRAICRGILEQNQLQAAALAMPVQNVISTLADSRSGRSDLGNILKGKAAEEVQNTLTRILVWPGRKDITAAYVIDQDGKFLLGKAQNQLLVNVPLDIFDSKIKGSIAPRTVRNGSRYDTFVPCQDALGKLGGYVVVGISAESLWTRATELTAGAIISFAIIALITVSVLALWVSRYMIRPLKQITENIAQGEQDGGIHLGDLTKSTDEIGLLARVTEKVLPELYRQRRKLQNTSAQLAAENAKLERTKWALTRMERCYRSAVEAATGIAYELDLATGKFVLLSRQVCDTVGFSAEDLPNSDAWVKHIHQDDRADATASLQACAAGQKSCFSRAYRFICKDGHALEMMEFGGLITDDLGKGSRISGIIIPAHMVPKSVLAGS